MARNATLERLYNGELNPFQAAKSLDTELGGITGVIWKEGLRIETKTKRHSITTQGLSKKKTQNLQACATLCYWLAQQNESPFPGELHLGPGISTKHYAQNFRTYTQTLLAHYTTERGEDQHAPGRN